MQKLVLVLLEQWEKIKDPKIQVKEVTVSQAAQKVVNFNPQEEFTNELEAERENSTEEEEEGGGGGKNYID